MELPSRFQIGEKVKYKWHEFTEYTVEEIRFTEAKVKYILRGKEGLGRKGLRVPAASDELERIINKN